MQQQPGIYISTIPFFLFFQILLRPSPTEMFQYTNSSQLFVHLFQMGQDEEWTMKRVNESCRKVYENESCPITINASSLALFSDTFSSITLDTPSRYPIAFANRQAEINFLSLLHIVSFGFSYNDIVFKTTGRSMSDVILFGIFGLHLSNDIVSSTSCSKLTLFQVASHFDLPLDKDEAVMTGVYISKPVRNILK